MSGVYDSEEEVESFDVTNDDLANEFNPDRPMFRQTKEDALYGMWARHEESGWSKIKKTSKYSEPVSFISGGFKDQESPVVSGDEANEMNKDNDDKKTSGFTKSTKVLTTVHQGAGKSYSIQIKGKKEKVDASFGGFERHTKGIGMKLMQKMGYQFGKGLGKGNQGILNPIEAQKRLRKAGLGAAGSERTKQSFIHFPTQDSEEEEDKEFKAELTQWRKGSELKTKKPKYKYKTVDDLRRSGKATQRKKDIVEEPTPAGLTSSLSNVKVIDMTGREKKIFSGYHAIAGRVAAGSDADSPDEDPGFHGDRSEVFSCPELLHNLDMLIEETEMRILSNDRQKRHEEDRSVSLRHRKEELEIVMAKEEEEMARMEVLIRAVKQCEERMNTNEDHRVLLDHAADVITDLQENYFAEYRMFELGDLAQVVVRPLLIKYFANWNPLDKPAFGVPEMKRWKKILEHDKSSYSQQNVSEDTDLFQHLMWEVWMPYVRSAILSWDARDCDSGLDLVESWMHLIPSWMLENILIQLVLPQLQTQVDGWDPLTDSIPLHSWIHPWLTHMQERLEPLYGPIRHKLAFALRLWHPRDPSARIILEPWRKVFSRGSWDAFLIKTILPKLGECMREMVIDPRNQQIEDFEAMLAWESIAPLPSLVTILEKHFFPKWLKALSVWLNGHPDLDEVTKWYVGWKEMFPAAFLNNSFVKDRFNQALEIMHRATGGSQRMSTPDTEGYEPKSSKVPATSVPTTFRDVIQMRAEERGMVFLPLPKSRDGQTLYRLGDEVIYIDSGVVFRKVSDSYVPVSLQELFR